MISIFLLRDWISHCEGLLVHLVAYMVLLLVEIVLELFSSELARDAYVFVLDVRYPPFKFGRQLLACGLLSVAAKRARELYLFILRTDLRVLLISLQELVFGNEASHLELHSAIVERDLVSLTQFGGKFGIVDYQKVIMLAHKRRVVSDVD